MNRDAKIVARNFRGFKKIDLDVSENLFLVGDNSSGKTSILHLIDFIYSTKLFGRRMFDSELKIDVYDFFSPYSGYGDVTIGYSAESNINTVTRFVTIKRNEESSSATVNKLTYALNDKAISLHVIGDSVKYKTHTEKKNIDVDLCEEIHFHKNGFSDLIKVSKSVLKSPHALIDGLIMAAILKSKLDIDPESISTLVFEDVLCATRHIGPLRGAPEVFYTPDRKITSTGSHFAAMIADLEPEQSSPAVKKFGSDSGLFELLTVQRVLKKRSNSPLAVRITKNGQTLGLHQVGFGVAQIAPIFVETLAELSGKLRKTIFLVQQPEVHLHPQAQAAFGEYLFDISKLGSAFVVETHSDFIIDRYRALINESNQELPNKFRRSSVIFCHSDEAGNHTKTIEIDPRGNIVDPPELYREFFLNELARSIF